MPRLAISLVALLALGRAGAQQPDPGLVSTIRGIRAIDNHSHPPALTATGQKDDDFDALPCDPLEPTEPALTTRPDNPRYLAAWKALYGYRYNDADSAHVRELIAAKQRVKAAQGDRYPAWVLDKLGIQTELANRVAMGRGLVAPGFRWVPFVDALLFPLDNSGVAKYTPDRKFFFAREDALLKRYMAAVNVSRRPATLDAYLSQIVKPLPSSTKQPICARSISRAATRRQPIEPTPATPTPASRRTPSIPRSRIWSFIMSPSRRGGSACLCTFTQGTDAAAISSSPDRIRCCSSQSSTTPRCARPSSSCCTAAPGRSRRRLRRSS
jgi:hypothetical protein